MDQEVGGSNPPSGTKPQRGARNQIKRNRHRRSFCALRVKSVTAFPRRIDIVVPRSDNENGGIDMRVFIACAIIITATLSLGGCVGHHEKAVSAEPLKLS